jgi:hypothetical protein
VYLQIKHPKAHAADVLNRQFKAEADKWVAESEAHAEPGVAFVKICEGDFAGEDVFWEHCTRGARRESARCPWVVELNRVWSLVGAEPVLLQLRPQMTGDWTAVVDASCAEQFADSRDPWTTFAGMIEGSELSSWRAEKDGLVLSAPQTGSCDPDRTPECKVPWDRLASFLKPDSPLKLIADKAPPGPRLTPPEDRQPPPPPEDPRRRPGGLSGDLEAAQKACDGGDARACVKVAEALFNGNDVSRDEALGQWMFWKACEAGEPTGCVNLGWSYLNDRENNQAGLAAAPYFGKACTDKVAIGCLGLGTIYRDGRNTLKNPKRAGELFKKACDGGVKAACSMVKAEKR